MRSYIDPTAPIAPQAILADDPKGAMDLATALCPKPRMSNLAHGLWGYGGTTHDGLELTVQSLGIGGPSAAAVVSDLAALGVRRAVRIGSCIALDPTLAPGAVLVVTRVEAADGAGSALTRHGANAAPDQSLRDAVATASDGALALVASVDLAEDGRSLDCDASAFDLSSAAALAAGARNGTRMACALVVAEATSGERLEPEALSQALLALGQRAAAALSDPDQAPGD